MSKNKHDLERPGSIQGRKYELYVTVGAILVVLTAAIWLAVSTQKPELASNKQEPGASSDVTARIGHLTNEINDLQSILNKGPVNMESLVMLANDQYDLGTIYFFELQQKTEGTDWFNRAVDSYQKALELDPKNTAARVDMATAAFYAGRDVLAKANFEQAIAQDPTYVNARLNYGVFLANTAQDYKGAIAQWEKILTLNADKDTLDHTQNLIKEAKEMMAAQNK